MKLVQFFKKFYHRDVNDHNAGLEKDPETSEILDKIIKLGEKLDLQNTETPIQSVIDGRNKKQDTAES